VSVREHISVTVRSTFTQFFDMLPIVTITVTCYVLPYLLPLFGPFDGVAISYVFMVVWMTSCLHTMARNKTHSQSESPGGSTDI